VHAQDPIFPTDNDWGIPALRLDLQGCPIVPPVCSWGSVARTAHMPGTWVFYTEDRRFGGVLREPGQLFVTGCNSAAEPNITLYDDTQWAVACHAVYRKRLCARLWQEEGIRVLVDLNVPERHSRLNLAGVPRGWRAYATRGYHARPNDLEREVSLADEWSGGNATVLVVGGGERVREQCLGLPGAVWVQDHMAQFRAKKGTP
jgi:hypothetical protein